MNSYLPLLPLPRIVAAQPRKVRIGVLAGRRNSNFLPPALKRLAELGYVEGRNLVVDYRSGLLDDAESTRALVRSGLVITAGEAWLLDVETNRWWRYCGGAPRAAHEQPGAGA